MPDGSTSEHHFQAAKATNKEDASYVMAAKKPAEAKRRGRSIECRGDWNLVKNDVMLRVLRTKFGKEPYRTMLLATGDAHLEEGNWWGDRYWGTVNRIGENWLGRLLMQVREELRDADRQ
jgi:ribA/ribD-fused uncharacterized protein